ncbi:FxLYD domain-containing protein [Halolamina salina]|uniref:FxLYD domain-containing protein n=1 Tax=Halolamina salina TaxID=1220023 RepID=A0ABD6B8D9_9EURY
MNRKHVAIAALVVVIALGGVAAALVTGFGPAPGGDGGSEGPSTPYENTVVVDGTDSGGGDAGSGGEGGATATAAPEPFTFVIENITECGQTCRDVNGTIVNQQDHTAEDVVIRSEIYTDGEMIWSGSSEVGDLASGESYTDTKRVELSYTEAYQVQQNDGQIEVKTFVETANATYVFTETRNVT